MMAKNRVRINITMDVEVSDDYLEALKKNLLVEVLKHCFKNNTRKIINETMEVLPNE
jgi:hypothetical protein